MEEFKQSKLSKTEWVSIEKKLGKMLKEFIGRFKNADFQSHAKYIEPHPENFQIQRHY